MNTIASRLAVATATTARQLSSPHLAAATVAAAAAHGSGLYAVVFLVLAVLFIGTLSSAVRGLATVLSELLRVAASVTSVMFTLVIAIFLAGAFLTHH
jgi:hypothetical protein